VRVPATHWMLVRSAPTLTLVFSYFGIGSLVLSLQILLRFHGAIPLETETQLVSGIGHLAVGAAGALLAGRLVGRRRPDWLLANAIALLYWALQIGLLDPPWFKFQGQGELVRTVAYASIALLTLGTAVAGLLLAPSSVSRMKETYGHGRQEAGDHHQVPR
jgi:hypothetical protein